ncbi:MAG: DUF5801 domain-containing protein, partial [Desulfobacterales bacterium]|nr:DUF5801 domain-containing protein [Desulfobacterales bacterium]
MIKVGTITGTGKVIATTADGKTRELKEGDQLFFGETIETRGNVNATIVNENGELVNSVAENSQLKVDETVLAKGSEDSAVKEVDAIQAALEQGEEIPEEETAVGEDDPFSSELGSYEGDESAGGVAPRSLGISLAAAPAQGDQDTTVFFDPIESLSALGVEVDETGGLDSITGTISVDYGPSGGFLVLSADGAVWDSDANTLTYSEEGVDIWEIVLDQATGEYTFTQIAAYDHGDDENDHDTLAEFEVTVSAFNNDGDTATVSFIAGIRDDGPTIEPQPYDAGNDDSLVIEGELVRDYEQGDGDGFELRGFGPREPMSAEHDIVHEGGAVRIDLLTENGANFPPFIPDSDGNYTDINNDGEQSEGNIWFYLKDENGDTVEGSFSMFDFRALGAEDGSVSPLDPYLYLEDLPAGNYTIVVMGHPALFFGDDSVPYRITISDNTDVDTSGIPETITGDETEGLVVKTVTSEALGVDFGTDGEGSIELSVEGGVWDEESQTLTYYQGEEAVWQIQLTGDAESGYGYEFTQLAAIDHDDDQDHDETAEWTVTLTATDGDTDFTSIDITVAIDDDGPKFVENYEIEAEGFGPAPMYGEERNGPVLFTDETYSMEGEGAGRPDDRAFVTVDFGQDGAADVDALTLSMGDDYIEGVDYTWEDGVLTFYQDGYFDGEGLPTWQVEVVEGRTDDGATTFRYVLTQLNAVEHDNTDSHNESETWTIIATAMDGDGDTDIQALNVVINDDGPQVISGNRFRGDESQNGREANPLVTGTMDVADVIDFGTDGPLNGDLSQAIELSMTESQLEGGAYTWENNIFTYYQDGDIDGTATWQIELTENSGGDPIFEFTQLDAVDHDNPNKHNEKEVWRVTVKATDGDEDTATWTIKIRIKDDGPSLNSDPDFVEGYSLSGDESLEEGETAADPYVHETISADELQLDFGTDGPFNGVDNDGLFLSVENGIWDADTLTLTYFQEGIAGDPAEGIGEPTWTMKLVQNDDDEYEIEFDQLNPIDHGDDGNDHDRAEEWTVTLTVKDGDGDTVSRDINVAINDDGPVLTSSEITSAELGISAEPEVLFADLRNAGNNDNPVPQALINGLLFTALAADGTEAGLYDAGPGVGIRSSDDGGSGRFKEINYYGDEKDGSSETLKMELPNDGRIGVELEVKVAQFFNNSREEERLEINFYKGDTLVDTRVVVSTEGSSRDMLSFNVDEGFDRVEFSALNDSMPGRDNSDFSIASVQVTTVREGVIGIVRGDIDGEFGTDGAGGFFLWDADAGEPTELLIESNDDGIMYTVSIDSETGEWVLYQYQSMDTENLDVEIRIYDGDSDWDSETVSIPTSQFVVGSDLSDVTPEVEVVQQAILSDSTADDTHTVPNTAGWDTSGDIVGGDAADVLIGDAGHQSFSYHYVLTLDMSDSMDDHRKDMEDSANNMIQNVFNQVNETTDGLVKISFQFFDTNSDDHVRFILFDKAADEVTMDIPGDGVRGAHTISFSEFESAFGNSIEFDLSYPRGGTNFEAGLEAASDLYDSSFDENHMIFISDGKPTWRLAGSRPTNDGSSSQTSPAEVSDLANEIRDLHSQFDSVRAISIDEQPLVTVETRTVFNDNHKWELDDWKKLDSSGNLTNANAKVNTEGIIFRDDLVRMGDENPHGIGQTVFTRAGAEYNLTFDVSHYERHDLVVVVKDADGNTISTKSSLEHYTFTGTGGTVTILFKGDGTGNYPKLDDIKLVETMRTPVDSVMDDIDSTGTAIDLEDSDELDAVLNDLVGDITLSLLGNDVIEGNDGDDLIFGDAVNSDGVAEDLLENSSEGRFTEDEQAAIESIADMVDGSGWAVFEALEDQVDSWTRSDTIRYIQ